MQRFTHILYIHTNQHGKVFCHHLPICGFVFSSLFSSPLNYSSLGHRMSLLIVTAHLLLLACPFTVLSPLLHSSLISTHPPLCRNPSHPSLLCPSESSQLWPTGRPSLERRTTFPWCPSPSSSSSRITHSSASRWWPLL